MTSISGPTTASYAYNGDGLRVSKTVSGTTTNYSWDPTGLGTVLSDGNEYVWGQGLISQVTSGGSATYAQSDGLGSIRLLTDGSGSVVGSQEYDAFGASRSQTGVQQPFGFSGEQVDAESGLVYLRARYDDPNQGRFLTQDPLGFAGSGVNLYAYAGNNPVIARDPSGLDCLDDDMMGGAGFSCLGGGLGSGGDGPSSDGGGEGGAVSLSPGPEPFGPEGEGRCETPVNPLATAPGEAVFWSNSGQISRVVSLRRRSGRWSTGARQWIWRWRRAELSCPILTLATHRPSRLGAQPQPSLRVAPRGT